MHNSWEEGIRKSPTHTCHSCNTPWETGGGKGGICPVRLAKLAGCSVKDLCLFLTFFTLLIPEIWQRGFESTGAAALKATPFSFFAER